MGLVERSITAVVPKQVRTGTRRRSHWPRSMSSLPSSGFLNTGTQPRPKSQSQVARGTQTLTAKSDKTKGSTFKMAEAEEGKREGDRTFKKKRNIRIHTGESDDEENVVERNLDPDTTNPNTLNKGDKSSAFDIVVSVGRIEDGSVILLTKDHHIIDMPLSVLPADTKCGHLLRFTVQRDLEAENERKQKIVELQQHIIEKY